MAVGYQGAVSQVIVDGVLLGNRTDSDPALTVRLACLADELGYREIWLGESTGHDAFALAVAVAAAAGELPSGRSDPDARARASGAEPATAGELHRKSSPARPPPRSRSARCRPPSGIRSPRPGAPPAWPRSPAGTSAWR